MRVILSLIIMINNNNNNNNHWCGIMFKNHTKQKSINTDFISVLFECYLFSILLRIFASIFISDIGL